MDAELETTAPETPDADSRRRHRRSRMIRAILAGGLVLGVGTAVTLAAWNDSEYATGTFTAGAFDLQGSIDGTTFADHPVGGPQTLGFTVSPGSMAPGDTVVAPFAVRLATGTTNDANVVMSVSTTGATTGLTYEVVRSASITCAAGTVDTTGTSLITAGTADTAVAGPNTFGLTKGATLAVPGATQWLCFKVTAGGGLVQNQTGTVTWQLTGTSI
jgi:predicted ribosomally synthesized peptide with SipW-like signal peptide